MKILEVHPFSQRDPKWKDHLLGYSKTTTINGYGCVLTSVSMLCKYFGKITNPAILNEAMKQHDGYFNQNLFIWSALTKIYPTIIYKGNMNFQTVPADIGFIKNQIDKRFPTVIRVEADEVGTPKGTHFLIVTGYEENNLWVIDPWDVNPHTFRLGERYSHNGSNKPEHIILGIRPYEFVGQFPEEQKPVIDKAQSVSEVFKGLTNVSPNAEELKKYVPKSLEYEVDDIIKNDIRYYDFRVKPLIEKRDDQWRKVLDEQKKGCNESVEQQKKDCEESLKKQKNDYEEIIKQEEVVCKQKIQEARIECLEASNSKLRALLEAILNLFKPKKNATV